MPPLDCSRSEHGDDGGIPFAVSGRRGRCRSPPKKSVAPTARRARLAEAARRVVAQDAALDELVLPLRPPAHQEGLDARGFWSAFGPSTPLPPLAARSEPRVGAAAGARRRPAGGGGFGFGAASPLLQNLGSG